MGNSHAHKNNNTSSKADKSKIKLQLHKSLTIWLKVARTKMYILETHLQTSHPNSSTSETASSLILEIMNCTFNVHATVTDFQRKQSEKNVIKSQLDQFTIEASLIQNKLKNLVANSLKIASKRQKPTYVRAKNLIVSAPENLRYSQNLLWKTNHQDIEVFDSTNHSSIQSKNYSFVQPRLNYVSSNQPNHKNNNNSKNGTKLRSASAVDYSQTIVTDLSEVISL